MLAGLYSVQKQRKAMCHHFLDRLLFTLPVAEQDLVFVAVTASSEPVADDSGGSPTSTGGGGGASVDCGSPLSDGAGDETPGDAAVVIAAPFSDEAVPEDSGMGDGSGAGPATGPSPSSPEGPGIVIPGLSFSIPLRLEAC